MVNLDPSRPTGWLVPPDDLDALTDAIVTVVNDPADRAGTGCERARPRARRAVVGRAGARGSKRSTSRPSNATGAASRRRAPDSSPCSVARVSGYRAGRAVHTVVRPVSTSPGATGVVTLLFTDLVGSSAMLDSLGEDAGADLRRAHFRLLRQSVVDAGGDEVKNLGDGLMVAFASAVRAARLRDRDAAGDRAAQPDDRPRVRPPRGARRPARRRGGPRGGRLLRDPGRDRGADLRLRRGRPDPRVGAAPRAGRLARHLPVRVARSEDAQGLRPADRAARAALGRRDAGRDATRRDRSAAGPARGEGVRSPGARARARACRSTASCRIALVVGEPGVGKSRVAAELARRHRDEVVSLVARAYPLGATASLGPWTEAIERHLRSLDAESVRSLAGPYLDDLAAMLPSVAAARGAAPDRAPAPDRVLAGLATLLGDLSEVGAGRPRARRRAPRRRLVVGGAQLPRPQPRPIAASCSCSPRARSSSRSTRPRPRSSTASSRTACCAASSSGRSTATGSAGSRPPSSAATGSGTRSSTGCSTGRGASRSSRSVSSARSLDEDADLEHPRARRRCPRTSPSASPRCSSGSTPARRSLLELLAVVGYRIELADVVTLAGRPLERDRRDRSTSSCGGASCRRTSTVAS